MEKLIKLRTPVRAIITKTVREVNEEFEKEEIDDMELRHKNKKLQECLTSLEDMDEKILEFIINADTKCHVDCVERDCLEKQRLPRN